MAPPKKTTKPPVQATLNFQTKKSAASAAAGSKDKEKGQAGAIVTTELTKQISLPAAATASPKKAKATEVKRRKVRSDSESEEEEELEEEPFVSDPESVEDVIEPEEVVEPVGKAKVVEPEVREAPSSTSGEDEDEVTFIRSVKGKDVPRTKKQLLADPEFKKAHEEAMDRVGGKLTGAFGIFNAAGRICGADGHLAYCTDSAKGESKATTILRVFDLSYEYGPCVGFTRMQRWQRAHDKGLDPPDIVSTLLAELFCSSSRPYACSTGPSNPGEREGGETERRRARSTAQFRLSRDGLVLLPSSLTRSAIRRLYLGPM